MSEAYREDFFKVLGCLKEMHPKHLVMPDLPPGEFFMLMRIAKSIPCGKEPPPPIPGVPVSGIHGHGNMSMPAVSQMLNNLEKKGYVERNLNPSDRRKVNVLLTERGKSLTNTAEKRLDTALETLMERYGKDNFKELCRLAGQLSETVQGMKEEELW